MYAALEVRTGKVVGKTAPRHTSAEFVGFLEEVVATTKWATEIHIVLDNLAAHKTKTVADFLEAHPEGAVSLYADLFILAESGGDLVLQS